MSVKLNSTGGGSVTLQEPTTASNFTLTLPAQTGTVVTTDGSNNLNVAGNLSFTSTGQRITGDFSNATLANRFYAQTSTTNGSTSFGVIPNGTGASSAYNVFAASDPTNTSFAQLRAGTDTSDVRLTSGISGSGTYLPMTFYTGGSERMRIDTSGNVGVSGNGGSSTNRLSFTYNGGTGEATIGPNSTGGSTFLTLGTSSSGTYAERVRIGSSGQLGIGGANYGTSGQVLISQGSGSAPVWATPTTNLSNSASASLNGVSLVDFTSIPSGVGRFTLGILSASLVNAGRITVLLGTGGGVATSGYIAGAAYATSTYRTTTSFVLHPNTNPADVFTGVATFTQISGNLWFQSGNVSFDNVNGTNVSGGYLSLGGTIDRVRVTNDASSNFDSGTAYIIWG